MSANAAKSSPVKDFLNKVLLAGFALSYLAPIPVAAIDHYLDLGMNPEAGPIAIPWAMLWILPTAAYLSYHPVTLPLPTWLTFGHLVTFGGVTPNVCDNPNLTLGVAPSPSDWPCFPAHFKNRIIKLFGPEGWRYLVQRDERLLACLFFLVRNIGMLAWFVATARKPLPIEDESCSQSKGDTKFLELKDLEKQ